MKVLGQENVEEKAHQEKETLQTASEIRSGTIDSVGGRGGHTLRETSKKGKAEIAERWRGSSCKSSLVGKTEFLVGRGAIVGGHRGPVFLYSLRCNAETC